MVDKTQYSKQQMAQHELHYKSSSPEHQYVPILLVNCYLNHNLYM